MSAEIVGYFTYEPDRIIKCPECGWSGRCGDHEDYFRHVLDIRCAECDRMLVIVPYPTDEETKAAAKDGSERAIGMLDGVAKREAFTARAGEHEMNEATEFPQLDGHDLVIDWDFESHEGEPSTDSWVVLRYQGKEIAREIAYWEGYHRFSVVMDLLKRRYGKRFAELRPTSASHLYLLGDSLNASGHIDSLNAKLAADRKRAS